MIYSGLKLNFLHPKLFAVKIFPICHLRRYNVNLTKNFAANFKTSMMMLYVNNLFITKNVKGTNFKKILGNKYLTALKKLFTSSFSSSFD